MIRVILHSLPHTPPQALLDPSVYFSRPPRNTSRVRQLWTNHLVVGKWLEWWLGVQVDKKTGGGAMTAVSPSSRRRLQDLSN